MRWKRTIALGAVLAAAVLPTAVPAGAQEPAGQQPAERPAAGPATAVTLITGDRVLVSTGPDGAPVATVRPAAGRERVQFTQIRDGRGLHVIPSDAQHLLAKGTIDRRLFNVSKLAADGYGDDKRPALPLIVQYQDDAGARSALRGVSSTKPLASINGAVVQAPRDQATALWSTLTGPGVAQSGIRKISLDGKVRASLDRSVPQTGAPAAWQAGLTGKGVKVAVLDTGVDDTHPDLAGKVVDAKTFSGTPTAADGDGHGTHVASTVAGSGAASGGKYKGMAPDSVLLNAKVLDDSGSGYDSWIIEGMEWAAASGAKVANLSLGATDRPGLDPLEEAVNRLSAERGILFVIAAGNDGPGEYTVGSPASADAALSVGAVDKQDQLAPFSSRGPRIQDHAVKPEITGPGVGIVAARAKGKLPERIVDEHYARLSGTSMATPHVAGAAAIMAQQHPDWSGDRIKTWLMNTAEPSQQQTVDQQGTGRVDLKRAISGSVYSSTPAVAFGEVPAQPVVRTVSYRNPGPAAVTLTLAATGHADSGEAAPAGMFTLDATQLTVPAGAEASVRLTADLRDSRVGRFGGQVVATDPAGTVVGRSAFTATKPRRLIDLPVERWDRAGKREVGMYLRLFGLDGAPAELEVSLEEGQRTVSVPEGRYLLFTTAGTELPDGRWEATSFIEPELVVDTGRVLTLDARRGEPVALRVDNPGAKPAGWQTTALHRKATSKSLMVSTFAPNPQNFFVVPRTGTNDFTHVGGALVGQPDANGSFANGPYLYNLAFPTRGRVPSPSHQVRNADLAELRTGYGALVAERTGTSHATPVVDGIALTPLSLYNDDLALPASRTEYFSPKAVSWQHGFYTAIDPEQSWRTLLWHRSTLRSYPAGHHGEQRWNSGVLAPGFTPELVENVRDGDVIRIGSGRFALGISPLADGDPGHAQVVGGRYDDGVWHWGFGTKVSLSRDGVEIPSVAPDTLAFPVPGAVGSYTLTMDSALQEKESTVSRSVRTAWTFASQRATDTTALALLTPRMAPELDSLNRAAAGQPLTIPIAVQRSTGSSTVDVKSVEVEASFDGGKTWAAAPTARNGADWRAVVNHPALADTDGSVSLRSKVIDAAGSKVEQTVTRAYLLK